MLAAGGCKICDPAMQIKPPKYALAIHGGASNIKNLNLTPEQETAYRETLSAALDAGYAVLKSGGTSVEATVAAVKVMEDSPLFNAGKGAVFTHEGTNEMDAAIMDGLSHDCGAVACVRRIKNPIDGARIVMQKNEAILLSETGAEDFVREKGGEIVDPSYFFTDYRWQQLQKALHKSDSTSLDNDSRGGVFPLDENVIEKYGTVGCVALDIHGNLAAATSTGGLVNKKYHRVGDSPLIGAGTYADNATCAVSCTGRGEDFIKLVVAYDIAAQMKYRKKSLKNAARFTILKRLKAAGGRGGCIAIDREGNIEMPFTTSGMFRGAISVEGLKTVEIYKVK
jgi:beta-aspartyl-peptidase (threonine type)